MFSDKRYAPIAAELKGVAEFSMFVQKSNPQSSPSSNSVNIAFAIFAEQFFPVSFSYHVFISSR